MATIVNDKQILLKESNIEFYREDKCIGSGDLEITSKNIIWTNNNNNNDNNGTEAYETNIYIKFDFCDIMLHAISRDTEAFPKECIYTQIDDENGNTLVSSSTRDKDLANNDKSRTESSKLVGISLGEKAQKAGIKKVSFDRNGYLYHGRVKSLAEGARESGLKF